MRELISSCQGRDSISYAWTVTRGYQGTLLGSKPQLANNLLFEREGAPRFVPVGVARFSLRTPVPEEMKERGKY